MTPLLLEYEVNELLHSFSSMSWRAESSFLAPMKFVALSEKIAFGKPGRPVNRLKAAIQAIVVRDDLVSM